jgi:hypothetical protein
MNKEISAYFKQYHKIDIDVVFNDKVIVITKLKLGHSKCRELFLGSERSNINTHFRCNFHTLEILTKELNSEDSHTKKFIKIWESVLNKTEKRDIVLIYRNPISTWLSGFYQDTINAYDNKFFLDAPYFTEYINSLNHDHITTQNFLRDFQKETAIRTLFKKEEYIPIISDILSKNLEYYMINNKLGTAHTKSWIPFIYKLINSKQIDTAKIKLLDLYDASLEHQLKNYLNIQKINQGDYRRTPIEMELLFDIVASSNYSHTITTFLKEDYNLYIDLKENYKQYHLNYE